ncbi:OsmC family peroxiredoxin [Thermopolyspora sp. NPDC052614]|uniref:OsmC family peroxiredoxin n=1 Tax=Thermopolyspora sp. NPDC052614 TaxID=3155682 RepID=UPI00342CB3A3
MPSRTSIALWKGDIQDGIGSVAVESGSFEGFYGFGSRFQQAPGTNPEELLAAAQAGSFSMFLANVLAAVGRPAESVETVATVTLDEEPEIKKIVLTTRAVVPGLPIEEFAAYIETAKAACPMFKALSAVPITVKAELV